MGTYSAFSEKWFAAWNSRDIDQIMELYNTTIDFMSPKIQKIFNKPSGRITNKDELRNYFMLALKANPNLHFEPYHVLEGVNSVVLYYKSINNFLSAEFMELHGMDKIVTVRAHYTPSVTIEDNFLITALIFARPGYEEKCREFENAMVPILQKHNVYIEFMANLQQENFVLPTMKKPTEIHLLRFSSQSTFEAYKKDKERIDLKNKYQTAIEKTILIKGSIL